MNRIQRLLSVRRLLAFGLVIGFAFALVVGKSVEQATAQEKVTGTVSTTSSGAAISALAISEERYRIGPGDVLDIRVFNRPQLSREFVRVEPNGMIQMPLIEVDIRAACRSESELADEIATLYKKYQRNPYVNVFVKEYSSTPVAVIGEVEKPGRFQLTRRVRLLELLAFAGGPTDKAGGKVQIAHTGSISICESPETASKNIFDFYSLKSAMQGGKDANPYINAGDIVSIPESDQAWVVGNVNKPTMVLLKEPVTVTQAVARAGGTLRASKLSGVVISRTDENGVKTVIPVDLSAIAKLRTPDILLQHNDIVAVPTDEGKIFLDKVIGAVTGMMGSVPYVLR